MHKPKVGIWTLLLTNHSGNPSAIWTINRHRSFQALIVLFQSLQMSQDAREGRATWKCRFTGDIDLVGGSNIELRDFTTPLCWDSSGFLHGGQRREINQTTPAVLCVGSDGGDSVSCEVRTARSVPVVKWESQSLHRDTPITNYLCHPANRWTARN